MGTREEGIVRSFLDCLVAGDLSAAVDHYADDAMFSASAWRDPVVGKEAVREALDREFGLSDYRYTIRSIASTDAVVLFEVVDEFRLGDKRVTMHWSGAWEINPAGKIGARRDYWDAKELEARLS